MAKLTVSNKDGRITTVDIDLYDEKNKLVEPNYNVNNGLVTQKIRTTLEIGKRRISYPTAYMQTVHAVMIDKLPDELNGKAWIESYDLTGFTLVIKPHSLDLKQKLLIVSTGY